MKFSLEPITFVFVVLSFLVFVDYKGGVAGGGGGSGGGGGGGRSGGGSSVGFGGSVSSVRAGTGYGRSGLSSRKGISRGGAAVIVGGGAAGYAAYRAHKNSKKGERGDSDFDSSEELYGNIDGQDYKTQESTSYYASEGIGMSAWALIVLILAVIFLGTIGWYCCNVFLPVWQDNRQMRRRDLLGRLKDEVPLQETPSTATPSP